MKSITSLYNQKQGQLKDNGHDSGADKWEKEKKPSRVTNGDKASNSPGSIEDEERATIQDTIGMIIHEIRNPLTAISLANQSLREEIHDNNLSPSFNVYTDIVGKNIARIETLLIELLHINCGNKIELTPTDIGDVIEECLEKADDRIFLKKVAVLKNYGPGFLINGNAEKLSIVFLNIIINSIEAVNEGEGNLWISVCQSKGAVQVIFKDNGSGMPPEVADHMFDKNFSGKRKGLGVGMSHVKEILALHNAAITVNSEPGTGTTIIIAFKRFE